jgi:hypothetical protein
MLWDRQKVFSILETILCAKEISLSGTQKILDGKRKISLITESKLFDTEKISSVV